jgi:replicative DNA helicase
MKQEHVILRALCVNPEYTRRVLPFLKDEYFTEQPELVLFRIVRNHVMTYDDPPSQDIIKLMVQETTGVTEDVMHQTNTLVGLLDSIPVNTNTPWLIDYSEKFCQDKAIYNAVNEAISILNGESKNKDKGVLPELLREACAVTFDTHVGFDILEDYERFYDYIHNNAPRVPFGVEKFNLITNGGLPPKTLTLFVGGTNVGKTLCMCSCAADNLVMGYDVLYVTAEMSEEEISKRIYANILNIAMDGLDLLRLDDLKYRVDSIRKKTMGKLIVVEYANGAASASTIRAKIAELKIKKKFTPKIAYVDYLSIMKSSRVNRQGIGKHDYVQSITQEFRALAQVEELPVVSAMQLNRAGYGSSDIDIDDTAESFNAMFEADLVLMVNTTKELLSLGQYLVKQGKNRLGPKHKHTAFVVGVDYDKQKLYDVEMTATENVGMKDITPQAEPSPHQLLMAKKTNNKFKGFTT